MTDAPPPIPATVLTGYLGAGKTTLLNRILSASHGRRVAVIVNEFGEVGIDEALVVGANEEVMQMSNGCLCCTFRGDLVRTLERLMKRERALDAVLIETTGLASPVPVAQTFFVSPKLRERVRLDAIVTVVDARHIGLHLEDSAEAREQIAFADVILLNKLDLVNEERGDELMQILRGMNALATLHPARHADVPLDAVLGVGGFDLERTLERTPDFLDGDRTIEHESGVRSISVEAPGELDAEKVTMWLRFLASRRGQDLYRMKGILALAGRDRSLIFHGVHTMFDSQAGPVWDEGEARVSRLVFIGRGLDEAELRRGLEACRG